MKKAFFTLTLLLATVFCHAQATIDPALQDEMNQRGNDEKIKVFILMKEQSDQTALRREANYFATKQERCEFVVETLKQQTQTSQANLLDLLGEMQNNGMVDDIRPLWIVNAITCEASKAAIYDLAQQRGIDNISYCKLTRWISEAPAQPAPKGQGREIADNVIHVNAPQVWDLGYTGQGILVAVIDTGINYNHVDFAGRLWDGGEEFPFHGYDFFNDDNDPMDDNGHGTHCAGTVSSVGTAGSQTGVAPGATVMGLKVFSHDEQTDIAHYSAAVQFALDHGVDLISWSFYAFGLPSAQNAAIRKICENVLEAGIAAAVSAGNIGMIQPFVPIPHNITLPGGCPPPRLHEDQMVNPGGLSCVICIGAVDNNNTVADFSSYGPFCWVDYADDYNDYPYTTGSTTEIGLIRPDVCAPGVDIKSLDYQTNDGYAYQSGTSMSTPCAAGVMALMLSKNRELTPAQIDEILENTAVKVTEHKDNRYGAGVIDALAAINAIEPLGTPETKACQAQVFPNPSTGDFTLYCEGMNRIEVYSIDGRLVNDINVTTDSYQLEDLENGIYVLQITKDSEKLVQRIIKY